MVAIVTSYVNPDLDGVACSIAVEALEHPTWSARIIGTPDSETTFVLNALGFAVPPPLTSWGDVSAIWLVDTHHPKQLPHDLPPEIVMRVTDHHPGGSPQHYPRADIQNEAVGAAATLIAERFDRQGVRVPSNIALLMQAAIASNTLRFRAPATSDRDRRVYKMLARIKPIDSYLLDGMHRARREKVMLETDALLESDVKLFDTSRGVLIVAQVEAPGALEILLRQDVLSSLKRLAVSRSATSALLNLVDTEAGKSAVLGTDQDIVRSLSASLHEGVDEKGIMHSARLLQRKTDIVPFLTK
jgi:manganese-dependent inorganic pyrophosphatase